MMRKAKIWGETIELFCNNTSSVHYLEINKGGFCSEHRHAQKGNTFFIIKGELEITKWIEGDACPTILYSGMCYERVVHIEPGVWHMFRAITDVKCIEVYNYTYDGVDIERRKEGGIDES